MSWKLSMGDGFVVRMAHSMIYTSKGSHTAKLEEQFGANGDGKYVGATLGNY